VTLHLNNPFALEPREKATHSLELEADVAAEILARQAQIEFDGRITTAALTVGQKQRSDTDATNP
jgi:hypothetical protein